MSLFAARGADASSTRLPDFSATEDESTALVDWVLSRVPPSPEEMRRAKQKLRKPVNRIDLYDSLANILARGRDTAAAFASVLLAECLTPGRAKSPEAILAHYIVPKIKDGKAIAPHLKTWLPDTEIAAIETGQDTGKLAVTLKNTARRLKRQQKISSNLLLALIMPLFSLLVSLLVLVMYGVYLLPMIEENFEGHFSGLAHVVKVIGEAAAYLVPTLLLLSPAIAWGIKRAMSHLTGPVRVTLDRYWPFANYRAEVSTQWLGSLALYRQAGMSTFDAVDHQLAFATPYLRERLQRVHLELKTKSLGQALLLLPGTWPDPRLVSLILNNTGGADTPDQLAALDDMWSERIAEAAERQAKVIEAVVILISGLIMMMISAGNLDLTQQIRAMTKF